MASQTLLAGAGQRLAVKEKTQPSAGNVVAGADVDDEASVGLLVGEDSDGGGVDVGDGGTPEAVICIAPPTRHGLRQPPGICDLALVADSAALYRTHSA